MIYVIPILMRESLVDGTVEWEKPCANMDNAKMHAENDADATLRWITPHGRFADHVATTETARYRIVAEQVGREFIPTSRR